MKARILWVEGKRAESPSFVPDLRKKGYIVEVVKSGMEALERLHDFDPDLVIVNAISMRSTGKRICQSLQKRAKSVPILLLSSLDRSIFDSDCANDVLFMPFTFRKLCNRITPLLPAKSGNFLHTGPIRLDLEHKRVSCYGREATLTPRLVHLLKMFMENPGVVLERDRLFKQIWRTDYLGDTRTLDVHISWLRQAIEEDPHRPRYLKTLRGVGYRLDI